MKGSTLAVLIIGCFTLIEVVRCDQRILEEFANGKLNLFQFRQSSNDPKIQICADTGFVQPFTSNGYCLVMNSNNDFETSFLWFMTDFELDIEYYLNDSLQKTKAQISFIKEVDGTEEIIKKENLNSTENTWKIASFKQHMDFEGYVKIKISVESMKVEDIFAINHISIIRTVRQDINIPNVSTDFPWELPSFKEGFKIVAIVAVVQFALIALSFIFIIVFFITFLCRISCLEGSLKRKITKTILSQPLNMTSVTTSQPDPKLQMRPFSDSINESKMSSKPFQTTPPPPPPLPPSQGSRFNIPSHPEPRFNVPSHPEPRFNVPSHPEPRFNVPSHPEPRFKLPSQQDEIRPYGFNHFS